MKMQRNASGVLGCACQQNQLGAVVDYDLIRIGGRDYSAAELQTKAPTIFAQTDTKVYTSAFDTSAVKYVTKAGNPLGKFYSYLKPGPNRTRSWLMLETGPARYVFVPNEVVGASAIANQNVQTAQEQIAQEKDAAERENDPIFYYIKKVGVPLALGAAAVYLIATFGKTFLAAKLSSKPALSGPGGSKMWWVAGGAIALIGGTWYYFKSKKQADASKAFTDYVQGNTTTAPEQIQQAIVANKPLVAVLPTSMPVLTTSLPSTTPAPAVINPVINPVQPYSPPVFNKRTWLDETLQQETVLAGFHLLR